MFLPSDVKVIILTDNMARFNLRELIQGCVILDGRSEGELIEDIKSNIRLRFLYLPLGENAYQTMKVVIANHLNEMESQGIIQRRIH